MLKSQVHMFESHTATHWSETGPASERFADEVSSAAHAAGSGQDGEDDYQNTPDVDDERWTTSYWTQYTVLLSRAARVKRFQAFATKV